MNTSISILELRPSDKKIVSNRWIFKTKRNQNGEIEKYKAKLMARGNMQEKAVDFQEVFAPIAKYEAIRALLAA